MKWKIKPKNCLHSLFSQPNMNYEKYSHFSQTRMFVAHYKTAQDCLIKASLIPTPSVFKWFLPLYTFPISFYFRPTSSAQYQLPDAKLESLSPPSFVRQYDSTPELKAELSKTTERFLHKALHWIVKVFALLHLLSISLKQLIRKQQYRQSLSLGFWPIHPSLYQQL